jgi:hypothetical protein
MELKNNKQGKTEQVKVYCECMIFFGSWIANTNHKQFPNHYLSSSATTRMKQNMLHQHKEVVQLCEEGMEPVEA